MDTLAIILSLVGNAWAIDAEGNRRVLKVGDELSPTDTLVTDANTRIELSFGDNQEITLLGEQELTPEMQAEFAGVEALSTRSAEEATSSNQVARDSSEEESEGHNFVQLVRIAEIVEADGFDVLTVARIYETVREVGMALETPLYSYDEIYRAGTYLRDEESNRHTGETGARLEPLSININVIAGDDIVDAAEARQDITLSGTVGGGAIAGDRIEVVVNGKTYTTTVNPDGKTWQVDVPGSELAQDSVVHASVTGREPNGIPHTATTERPYEVDLDSLVRVEVELLGDTNNDGIYNASEIEYGKVSAKVTLNPDTVKVGDRLVVKDTNGNVLLDRPVTQADIDNGVIVQISVGLGDTSVSVEATVTDPFGNEGQDTDQKDVDNVIPDLGDQGLGVEFQGMGDDGVYNKQEIDDNGGEVDAKVTFDQANTEPGDTVTIRDQNGNIIKDENGVLMENYPLTQDDIDNGIIVKVPVADGETEVKVEATITDQAGNSNSADATAPVDNVAPEEQGTLGDINSDDSDVINIDLSVHFKDNVDNDEDIRYEAAGLPDGLTMDPFTGKVTGTIDRSASQNGPNNDGKYEVTITTTDTAGNSSDHTIIWTVENPVPVTNPDAEATDKTEALNIVKELGVLKNDHDPDGDPITVTGVEAGDTQATSDTGVGAVIQGQYGSLELQADGSYTYTPDVSNSDVWQLKDGDTLEDTFTYTVSDDNGGQSTETLTITINGASGDDPLITPNDANGSDNAGHITVHEKGLNNGTDAGNGHTVDNKITITAANGLAEVEITDAQGNKHTFDLDALTNLAAPGVTLNVNGGTLTLTGFTPETITVLGEQKTIGGTLEYTYELETPQDHTGVENIVLDIPLSVKDEQGKTGSTDLSINVLDDAPVANDDANEIDEDDNAAITGNVIANGSQNDAADSEGADDAVVTQIEFDGNSVSVADSGDTIIQGEFGTLTIKADGSYTYELDNSNLNVQSLTDGETLTETFTYTLTDGDGDTASADLTITINGKNDDVELEIPTDHDTINPDGTLKDPADYTNTSDHVVFESGLTGGSNPEADALKVESNFTFSALDGLDAAKGMSLVYTDVNGNNKTLSLSASQVEGLTGNPVSITTEYGELTLNGYSQAADGEITINYEYLLERAPSVGTDAVNDDIKVTITDRDGDSQDADISIKIVDDAPAAVADTNAIDEDDASVDGNVLVNDTMGADGATVTAIESANTNTTANQSSTNAAGDLVIEGEFGTLTIRADGSYTYELDNSNVEVNGLKDGDKLNEKFTYTLTDGDGDTATAELDITINGKTDGQPSLNIADLNGVEAGHVSIVENDSDKVTGEFTVQAPDGLNKITIGGEEISLADLEALTTTPKEIDGTYGKLTLTDYDPATGKVSYEYALDNTDGKDHNLGKDSVKDEFAITVTDNGGDSTTPENLEILITDTAPVANPDTGSITEDSGSNLAGNLMTDAAGKDDLGADATTVTDVISQNESSNTASNNGGVLTIDGEYGTLTIQPNGEYEYELHDSTKVNALKDGDVREEIFEYTITDADGDSDSTTLTITVNGNTDGTPEITAKDENGAAVDGHITVNESGLAGGTNEGVGHTASGEITIEALDGIASITIAGETFTLADLQGFDAANPSSPITVPGGELVINGFTEESNVGGVSTNATLSYTYTLTDEQTHAAQGNDDLVLDIPLSITDAGNETTTGSLQVQVIDDVPVLKADTGDVTEGATLTVDEANGVLSNDEAGADGWHANGAVVGVEAGDTNATHSGGVGGRIDGEYGYLILNADGSYEYVSTADAITADAKDVFTYTVRDADGDEVSTTLTINVTDVSATATDTTAAVEEAGVVGGSQAGDGSNSTTGTLDLQTGWSIEAAQSGSTAHGTWSIDISGNFTYTLNQAVDNRVDGEDSFTYIAKDANGNTVENTVTITIIDDVPVATNDENTIDAGSYAVVTGDVLKGDTKGGEEDTLGADGATITGAQSGALANGHVADSNDLANNGSIEIQGQYGKLTLNADGTYSYQRDPNTAGGVDDVFTYTITDGDGDQATASLTIKIGDAEPTISGLTLEANGGELTFYEKNLTDGTDPDGGALTQSGDFTIQSPDGIASLAVGGETVIANGVFTATTVTTPHGVLEITGYNPATGQVSYTYELKGTQTHTDPGADAAFDNITIELKDQDGDNATSSLDIKIVDDIPTLELSGDALDTIVVSETGIADSTATSNADFSTAFKEAIYGADGAASNDALVYELELKSDGVDSGLTSLGGDSIKLYLNGDGKIEGRTTEDGDAYFTISVDQNGNVTLIQKEPLKHPDTNSVGALDEIRINKDAISLKATATDGDGDKATASVDIGDRFVFQDAGPTAGLVTEGGSVDEANLAIGSNPDTDQVSFTGQFTDLDFGADGAGDIQFTEDGPNSTVGRLVQQGIESGNEPLQYVVSNDGHTLTAYRGDARTEAAKIFEVEIIDPQNANGDAGYKFTLHGALDHYTEDGDRLTNIKLPIEGIEITDGDGDSVTTRFEVKVKDDTLDENIAREIELDEDSPLTFNANADATKDNTNVVDEPKFGTVTVEDDGTLTYTPNDNFSGDDSFTYTTTVNGVTKTYDVNVTVHPVADAPKLEANKTITVKEDGIGEDASNPDDPTGKVSLGLTLPEITDNAADSAITAADDFDYPERLGEITLSLGAQGTGTFPTGTGLAYTKEGGALTDLVENGSGGYTIVIVENSGDTTADTNFHHSEVEAGQADVNYLTQAEYESLVAKLAEDRHENFEVEVSVKSYEVDSTGKPLSDNEVGSGNNGVNGAESKQTITVDVQAVTDEVELTLVPDATQTDVTIDVATEGKTANVTFNEDKPFNLTAILKAGHPDLDGEFKDTDGSEQRELVIEGLPKGSIVKVGTVEHTIGGDGKLTIENLPQDATNFPEITVQAPKDFSGDIEGVKVTINAKDTDSDSTVTTDIKSDDVTLNLYVKPVAGDVALDANDVSTPEDTAVNFMKNIKVTDDGSDGGNEVITKVVFELPADWSLTSQPMAGSAGNAVWTVSGNDADGYTIEFTAGSEENRELALSQFEVTPPAHSSKDETIKVTVTTEDTNTVNNQTVTSDPVETELDIKVEVTPVAEKVTDPTSPDYDTDGDNTADLTMTQGHSYTTPGVEDEWFDLGTDGAFDLKDGWTNQDGKDAANGGVDGSTHGSEETFALFTPTLTAGDGGQVNALGSQFQWHNGSEWITETYVGGPIEVPIEFLDTLQFKGPENFSGMFDIKVQVKTVDYDEDDVSITDEAISGEAWLKNILIAPKADTSTTGLTARVEGNEDEMMNLSIRPKSSDPSETFDVTVGAIPDGAIITYGGYAITEEGVFEYSVVDGSVVLGDPETGTNITVSADGSGKWQVEFEDFYQGSSTPPNMTITAPEDSNEKFELNVSTVVVDVLELPPGTDLTGMDLTGLDVTEHSDGSYTITSKSDPEKLSTTVEPLGVADPADFELKEVDGFNGVFTEGQAEQSGAGFKVIDLIQTAELKDTDGSETLTFKISGLPEGFTVEGATFLGGSGENREWAIKDKTQLDSVIIKAPENFNGVLEFNIHTITTENDGDSLDEKHDVTVKITPTPEANMSLSTTIAEDVSTKLDFSVVHQNGDTDETITKVWIKASDVDGSNLTLTLNGNQLSAKETIDGDEYYVIDQADLNNIYAQGSSNWHGNTSFDVKYEVTDPGKDGLDAVTGVFDDRYQVTVTPVTDQVTIGVTEGADSNGVVTLTKDGTHTIKLEVGNEGQDGGDYDGSEHLTRITVENVPEGVVLTNPGAHYLGGGTWVLTIDAADGKMHNGPVLPELEFEVHSSAGGLEDHKIKVTVTSEDAGNGQETHASTDIFLNTDFTKGDADAPAEIVTWEQTDFDPTEDTHFTLDQAINAQIDDTGVANNSFTVTLKDLPPGTVVAGMEKAIINGEEVWTATASGGDDELQNLLASITVTPPKDFNSNQGEFKYDATLTTHTPTGGSDKEDIAMDQAVTPVTDDADVTTTVGSDPVVEGEAIDLTIDVSNAADDPGWTLVDGKLYLQVDSSGLQGKLFAAGADPDTDSPLDKVNFDDENTVGLPPGDYYVIELGEGQPSVDLQFKPDNQYTSGDVKLNTWVQGQEANASNTITTNTNHTITVEPVNNGVDFTVGNVSGVENPGEPDKADLKTHAIELTINGDGLVDADGSEEIFAILLKNLPNGFLVFTGDSVNDASQAEMSENTGGAGGMNTWLLGSELPKYIGIVPPKNWSGSIEDILLSVISGETSLDDVRTDDFSFDLTIEPVANGVELTPTASFGKEGDIVGLNLNAKMEDLQAAGDTDQHVELITLSLDGFGEYASFYIGDELIMDRVEYDEGTGKYTIKGLTQDDVDNLGFVQAKSAMDELKVQAQTQEYERGQDGKADLSKPAKDGDGQEISPSDWSDEKTITANITDQFGTTGNDELLYTGDFINGREGDDTIQLRFGEDVSGSDLATNLKNIEKIDLSIDGKNEIDSLSIEDVLSMTDDRNALEIFGIAGEDKVTLDGDWTKGNEVGDYTIYTGTHDGQDVTLKISNDIVID